MNTLHKSPRPRAGILKLEMCSNIKESGGIEVPREAGTIDKGFSQLHSARNLYVITNGHRDLEQILNFAVKHLFLSAHGPFRRPTHSISSLPSVQ